MQDRTAEERLSDVKLWYHTIDLGDGRTSPGGFDLRGVCAGSFLSIEQVDPVRSVLHARRPVMR